MTGSKCQQWPGVGAQSSVAGRSHEPLLLLWSEHVNQAGSKGAPWPLPGRAPPPTDGAMWLSCGSLRTLCLRPAGTIPPASPDSTPSSRSSPSPNSSAPVPLTPSPSAVSVTLGKDFASLCLIFFIRKIGETAVPDAQTCQHVAVTCKHKVWHVLGSSSMLTMTVLT